MLMLYLAMIFGMIVLIVSTDQFVSGASTIAKDLKVSSVLVGAVILGCGTGLPELALAFYGSHVSPWRQLFNLGGDGGQGLVAAAFFIGLVTVLALPTLFPERVRRHSPMILAASIAFAAMLRGSLDRYEGAAMLVGFAVGIAWIIHGDRKPDEDPFSPIIDDEYEYHGGYIEAPVMTPVQVGVLRSMIGLLGTAIGAQVLAFSALRLMEQHHTSDLLRNLVFVGLGSLLPHIVVAIQALKHHHEGLAIGNLIGSSLFNSLAIGGLVSIIRPYQAGGAFTVFTLGVIGFTALLTWMLLHTDIEMSRKQGVGLLAAYVGLILVTVL